MSWRNDACALTMNFCTDPTRIFQWPSLPFQFKSPMNLWFFIFSSIFASTRRHFSIPGNAGEHSSVEQKYRMSMKSRARISLFPPFLLKRVSAILECFHWYSQYPFDTRLVLEMSRVSRCSWWEQIALK